MALSESRILVSIGDPNMQPEIEETTVFKRFW